MKLAFKLDNDQTIVLNDEATEDLYNELKKVHENFSLNILYPPQTDFYRRVWFSSDKNICFSLVNPIF